jgi:hypothetical protein
MRSAIGGYASPYAARLRSAGCCRRKPISSLFQALIVATAIEKGATSSSSENAARASSQTSSGAWVSAIRVSDSAQASAARSRSV